MQLPSFRRFVYNFALFGATGMLLFVYAWVAVLATIIGGFVPGLDELNAVGTHYLSIGAFGVTLFCLIFYQADRYAMIYRQQQPQPRQQAARPIAARNQQETRRLSSRVAVGRRGMFPLFDSHYAAVYRSLERQEWKITRRAIDLEVDGVKVFPNIAAKYAGIIKEWNRLSLIDGYATGEAHETWYLNERGRAIFAKHGRVTNSPYYPTEDN